MCNQVACHAANLQEAKEAEDEDTQIARTPKSPSNRNDQKWLMDDDENDSGDVFSG